MSALGPSSWCPCFFQDVTTEDARVTPGNVATESMATGMTEVGDPNMVAAREEANVPGGRTVAMNLSTTLRLFFVLGCAVAPLTIATASATNGAVVNAQTNPGSPPAPGLPPPPGAPGSPGNPDAPGVPAPGGTGNTSGGSGGRSGSGGSLTRRTGIGGMRGGADGGVIIR